MKSIEAPTVYTEFEGIVSPRKVLVTIQGDGSIILNRRPSPSELMDSGSKKKGENKAEAEFETYRQKAWFRKDIGVHIPSENIHECLKGGAKAWGRKIPGEGMKTYAGLLTSAIICEDMPLGIKSLDDERLIPFAKVVNGNPTKSKKGGSCVVRVRPLVAQWGGSFLLHIFDKRLTDDVMQTIIQYAGIYNGIGDWRPVYGRFRMTRYEVVSEALRASA